MTILTRSIRPLLLCVIVAAAPLLYGDEVMDRLVRLVGRDAGLCVEVPHLDESLTAFEQSEFFQRLNHSRIYADWKTGIQHRKLAELAALVEKHSGKPVRQFIREVFGTAVVVAAYAEPGPKMSAILMSEAMSREGLESAIAAWNRVEPHQIESITFSTHTYYRRTCIPSPDIPRSRFTTRLSAECCSCPIARNWCDVRSHSRIRQMRWEASLNCRSFSRPDVRSAAVVRLALTSIRVPSTPCSACKARCPKSPNSPHHPR